MGHKLESRRRRYVLALSSILLIALFSMIWRSGTKGRSSRQDDQPSRSIAGVGDARVAPDAADQAAPIAWTPDAEREVLATRMMFLAHEPLRAPSVDDPDSIENMRVAQQMITKAFRRLDADSSSGATP